MAILKTSTAKIEMSQVEKNKELPESIAPIARANDTTVIKKLTFSIPRLGLTDETPV